MLAAVGVCSWALSSPVGHGVVSEASSSLEPEPDPVVVRTSSREQVLAVSATGLLLAGQVLNSAGNPEPKVEVRGCGAPVLTDKEGRFAMEVPPGGCVLWPQRVDGVLPTEGRRVEVSGRAGERLEVTLELPEYPQGFIGVFLGISGDANRVVSVVPGSRAESEGVRPGHEVLTMDGENVRVLDAAALWSRLRGDAGTTLRLTLRKPDGSEYEVALSRELVGE